MLRVSLAYQRWDRVPHVYYTVLAIIPSQPKLLSIMYAHTSVVWPLVLEHHMIVPECPSFNNPQLCPQMSNCSILSYVKKLER